MQSTKGEKNWKKSCRWMVLYCDRVDRRKCKVGITSCSRCCLWGRSFNKRDFSITACSSSYESYVEQTNGAVKWNADEQHPQQISAQSIGDELAGCVVDSERGEKRLVEQFATLAQQRREERDFLLGTRAWPFRWVLRRYRPSGKRTENILFCDSAELTNS